MQTKTGLAIFAILGAITLVLAPSLISQASAKQTATITCTQQTGSGPHTSSGPCSGSSATNNPNRDEACTAKNAGQQNKLC